MSSRQSGQSYYPSSSDEEEEGDAGKWEVDMDTSDDDATVFIFDGEGDLEEVVHYEGTPEQPPRFNPIEHFYPYNDYSMMPRRVGDDPEREVFATMEMIVLPDLPEEHPDVNHQQTHFTRSNASSHKIENIPVVMQHVMKNSYATLGRVTESWIHDDSQSVSKRAKVEIFRDESSLVFKTFKKWLFGGLILSVSLKHVHVPDFRFGLDARMPLELTLTDLPMRKGADILNIEFEDKEDEEIFDESLRRLIEETKLRARLREEAAVISKEAHRDLLRREERLLASRYGS